MASIGFCSTWGGCFHYRCELPAITLAERGYNTWAAQEIDIDPTTGRFGFPLSETEGFEPDIVVLAGGHPRQGPEIIRAARHNGQRIIVDCDDWPSLPASNPHYTANMGQEKLAAMSAAEAVIYSTAFLHENCEIGTTPAFVARNMIRTSDYRQAAIANERRRAERGEPFIVGYRGMLAGFHDADVAELRGQLPADVATYLHVGADPRGKTFANITACSGLVRERFAVAFDEGYPNTLAGVDFAVIPYDGRPFSQAKSNIAGLEWSAAGVPFLTSPHPEYPLADWVADGGWRAAIEAVAKSPALRDAMRDTQREHYAGAADIAVQRGAAWVAAFDALGIYPEREPIRA